MELSEGNLYPSHSNEPLYARKTQQNINSLKTNNSPYKQKYNRHRSYIGADYIVNRLNSISRYLSP